MTTHASATDKQHALQARADGRLDEAVAVWRRMLRAAPDDWRTGLELKADLASQYHYSESDPAFRRAARALPDAEWFAHYAGLFTYHAADLSRLATRARALLRQRPGDASVHLLLGNVLFQHRRWAAAARHLAQAPASADTAAKAELARLYQRLGRLLPEAAPAYGVALINLDRNNTRRRDVLHDFRHGKAPLFRVAGVEGRLLPAPAVRRLADEAAAAMRGTLGCFLSHVSAWETMLARGLAHCLIIEDDVVPMLPLPAGLGGFGLPDDYDLCFVNDRLQPRLPAEQVAGSDRWQTYPLAQAFAGFPPEDNAPGADGYLLSVAGARKLLAWVEQDGFAHDVDWRLLTYGLHPAEYDALPRHSHAWGVIDALRHGVRRSDRLHAYVLHPALIRSIPISSDREDDNRHRRA